MSKLSDKEKKETEILSKRIMPKTDFNKVLEHDKLYYNTLNQALEFNVVKQDILGKKCQSVIAKQNRKEIIENIDTLCDWAETQVKVLDMKGKYNCYEFDYLLNKSSDDLIITLFLSCYID